MPSKSIVRVATPVDKEEIWRLFKLMFSETHMFSLSEKKVNYYLDRILSGKDIKADDAGPRGFIGVIGSVGALEGAIMLMIGTPWYSDDLSIEEYLNFVDPEHRASNHSRALISYAKHIIDQVLPQYPSLRLVIGVLSLKRTAAKIRLYGQTLVPAGAFFTYPAMADATAEPLKRLYRGH